MASTVRPHDITSTSWHTLTLSFAAPVELFRVEQPDSCQLVVHLRSHEDVLAACQYQLTRLLPSKYLQALAGASGILDGDKDTFKASLVMPFTGSYGADAVAAICRDLGLCLEGNEEDGLTGCETPDQSNGVMLDSSGTESSLLSHSQHTASPFHSQRHPQESAQRHQETAHQRPQHLDNSNNHVMDLQSIVESSGLQHLNQLKMDGGEKLRLITLTTDPTTGLMTVAAESEVDGSTETTVLTPQQQQSLEAQLGIQFSNTMTTSAEVSGHHSNANTTSNGNSRGDGNNTSGASSGVDNVGSVMQSIDLDDINHSGGLLTSFSPHQLASMSHLQVNPSNSQLHLQAPSSCPGTILVTSLLDQCFQLSATPSNLLHQQQQHTITPNTSQTALVVQTSAPSSATKLILTPSSSSGQVSKHAGSEGADGSPPVSLAGGGKSKRFVCELCGAEFNRNWNLCRHQASIHHQERPLTSETQPTSKCVDKLSATKRKRPRPSNFSSRSTPSTTGFVPLAPSHHPPILPAPPPMSLGTLPLSSSAPFITSGGIIPSVCSLPIFATPGLQQVSQSNALVGYHHQEDQGCRSVVSSTSSFLQALGGEAMFTTGGHHALQLGGLPTLVLNDTDGLRNGQNTLTFSISASRACLTPTNILSTSQTSNHTSGSFLTFTTCQQSSPPPSNLLALPPPSFLTNILPTAPPISTQSSIAIPRLVPSTTISSSHHPPDSTVVSVQQEGPKHTCTRCGLQFNRVWNLQRHQQLVHTSARSQPGRLIASKICPVCRTMRCRQYKQLIDHVQREHNVSATIEQTEFASETDFLNWKHELERQSGTSFAQKCGSNEVKDSVNTYFACNRTGFYQSKSAMLAAAALKNTVNGTDAKLDMKKFDVDPGEDGDNHGELKLFQDDGSLKMEDKKELIDNLNKEDALLNAGDCKSDAGMKHFAICSKRKSKKGKRSSLGASGVWGWSVRMGATCTAFIRTAQNKHTGRIKATYCLTHLGH